MADRLLYVTEARCPDTGECTVRKFLYEVQFDVGTVEVPNIRTEQFEVAVNSSDAATIEAAKVIADAEASTKKAALVAANAYPPVERYDVSGEVTL